MWSWKTKVVDTDEMIEHVLKKLGDKVTYEIVRDVFDSQLEFLQDKGIAKGDSLNSFYQK